jgi:nitroreductase
MDLYEAIHDRRTIHSYEPHPMESGALERVLGAAHLAPNHKLTWPWRFLVVGSETRDALVPIAFELKNATDPLIQGKIRQKLINPSALVVVTQILDSNGDEFRIREDYAATCCAIQNMMLAARAEGLGSKWSTGALTHHPKICELLGVSTRIERVVGFVWLGMASTIPTIERPPVEAHVRHLP